MTNQSSSAVDELRTAATDFRSTSTRRPDIVIKMVPLELAERIITAQEQRLGEVEAELEREKDFHLDYSQHADKRYLELHATAKQQEQRIGELEAQLADAVLAMDAAEAAGRPEHESLQDSIEYFVLQWQIAQEKMIELEAKLAALESAR